MSQTVLGNARSDNYVGYLNDVDLFIEAMYDEKRNPNGIGKLKICVDGSSIMSNIINSPIALGAIGGAAGFFGGLLGGASQGKNAVNETNMEGFYNEVYGGDDFFFEKQTPSQTSRTIKFIVNDDISFNGGNAWEESIDKLIKGTVGKDMAEWVGAKSPKFKEGGIASKLFGNMFKAVTGAGQAMAALGGTQVKTLMQTIKFWQGSNGPGSFRLKFNLLATSPDMDIRKALLALYATVYPLYITDAYNDLATTFTGYLSGVASELERGNVVSALGQLWNNRPGTANLAASGILAAPLGYNPVEGYLSSMYPTTQEKSGLLDLRIGKWLHIPNLLAKDFNATISKVTTRFGFPLYATCVIDLVPVRMWTLADVYDTFFSSTVNNEATTGLNSTTGRKTRISGVPDKGTITKVGEMP